MREQQHTKSAADIEATLTQIWRYVLQIESIKNDDNFFDLGGHSLLITRVISRIESKFGIDFPIKAFFDAPTIAEQALLIGFMTDH